jgi:hypothetical protein
MSTPNPTPLSPGLVSAIAANRGAAGIAMAILGIAVLAVPVTLVSKYEWEFLPVVITTGALGLFLIAIGVSLKFLASESGDVDRVRMLVLLASGAGGLLIAATGVCLAYLWWNVVPAWLRDDEREGLWKIFVAAITLLGGLAVMFVGLQAARAEERTNPALRRLVFGYNAVLSGVLLLILLGVLNAYVSARYTSAIESVDRGDTALSERAVNVAKGLERPVHFFVIWATDDPLVFPLRAFLSNLEDVSSQIRVTYMSPGLDTEAIRSLARKYPGKIPERETFGVLVVRGEEKPENATFLNENDLYTQEGGRGSMESPQLKFKGEDRIIASLMSDKAIVYVTQGNGEPDLNDSSPRSQTGGMGVLRERLAARGNMDVRPLNINPADPKVPDDASIVIVANPKPPIGAGFLKALRGYMIDRQGKAVILLDVPSRESGEKSMPATGLESLLSEFGVEATNERIYTAEELPLRTGEVIDDRDFVVLRLASGIEQSGSELAKAFKQKLIITRGVRVVRPSQSAANPVLRAEPLLATVPQLAVWTETDMSVDPMRTLADFAKNPADARKRISQTPLPAAVVVTQSAPPAHPPAGPPPTPKPRLIVFGDSTLVTNLFNAEGSPVSAFDFVASTLDWLSERPTSMGVGAKSLKYYSLDPTASGIGLVVLPGLVALIGILGLGLGVWVVRRR